MPTQAGTAIELFMARAKEWPGSKFKPARCAVKQTDPKLPHVRFYRYPDGSAIRHDVARHADDRNGDLQEF